MAYTVAGLIDCFQNPSFGPLTQHRPIASTSILGRFSFMDFHLSNFLNSGILNIGILCQNHIRSLTKHVGNGRSWITNTKRGSLVVLYDEPMVSNPPYNTDIADIIENKVFFRECHPDYVVISMPNFVYEADFKKLVDDHIASGDRISLLYTHVDKGLKNNFIGASKLGISQRGKVNRMEANIGDEDSGDISLGCMILDYPMLESLVEYARSTSVFFNLADCLKYLAPTVMIRAVKFDGYVRDFDSLPHYLEYSLELLDRKVFDSLFMDGWPIHTSTYDTPPVQYRVGSAVTNSYLANGSVIEGVVTNSILGRHVKVGKDCKIINSIIGNDVVISDGTHIENAVIDRDAQILHVSEIVGTKDDPIYIARGDIV